MIDLGLSDKNVFFWWPDAQGNSPPPSSIHSNLVRFSIINPHCSTDPDLALSEPQVLESSNSEFYRIDDRFATQPYRHCFFTMMDPALGTDFPRIEPNLGGGYPLYNALAHFDNQTGEMEVYFPGSTRMVQEPVFIPRNDEAQEGDGYLVALVNNYKAMESELHLVDTEDFSRVKARILLPVRLRPGLHGNWVDGRRDAAF